MAQRRTSRNVPLLDIRASFEPKSVDSEKRTAQLTWTTGAAVLRGGFWSDPYWEELSLDPKHVRMQRLQSGAAPLLNTHGQYDLRDVIGVVESAELKGKSGTATVRFDSGADGEEAFRKVREGILRNVSVGYRTYKMQKVEGGEATTPTYRAVDWEPYEISLVPIGADAGAVTRSGGGDFYPCVFTEERNMDPENPTPTTPAPTTQPTTPAPAATRSEAEIKAEAARAERERCTQIRRIGTALKRPDTEIQSAIDAGTELAAYRAQAQDAFVVAEAVPVQSARATSTIIAAGEDNREKWLRGAMAWMLQRAAVADSVVEHAKQRGEKLDLDPGEFRGLSLIELAKQSLERGGVRTAGMSKMEIVAAAFTQRGVAGAQGAGDFTVLLENVMYKTLLARYATVSDTWKRFCRVGSVADFRASNRYRQGSFGALQTLNESGEFKNKQIPDGEKQSITAGTKGNIIAITRQAIVNDDLGAFVTMAADLGRAAGLTIELDVYALLALNGGLGPTMSDGNPLFDNASHFNVPAGTALGSNAIDLDRVAMASQKDPSKNEILALTPAILLVPISLEGTAKQINNGQYDFDALNTKNPWVPNKVAGVFRDIIGTARLTGTRRYLFADPGDAPTIEVAFLDGMQAPYMEMQQGWRVDGAEWKVRLDYGVGAIDFRGAITNAGA